MSFDIEKFQIFSGNSKSETSFQICGYKSYDTIDTVISDGYFNVIKDKLRVNNIIQFLSLSDSKMYFLRVSQIHLYNGVKTAIVINDNNEESEEQSNLDNEILSYGKKYAKIKELVRKSDAGFFVVSCEYKTHNLGIIRQNSDFSTAMKGAFDQYYSDIESATTDELDGIEIDFTTIVNTELERIRSL